MHESEGVTRSDFVRFTKSIAEAQNPPVTHREFDQLVNQVGRLGDEQETIRDTLSGLVRIEERQQSMFQQLVDLQRQYRSDRDRIEDVNKSSEARDDVLTEAVSKLGNRMDVWKHRLWLPGLVLGGTGFGAGVIGPKLAAIVDVLMK